MAHPLHLIVVDDDEHKRALIVHQLGRQFERAVLFQCASGAEAIEHLKTNAVDAIVTDHSMHPVNGIELIQWVRARTKELPILMVTGHPEIEAEALKAGATKVITFDRFREVGPLLSELLNRKID